MTTLQEKKSLTEAQVTYLQEFRKTLETYRSHVTNKLLLLKSLLVQGLSHEEIINKGFESYLELFHSMGEYNFRCEWLDFLPEYNLEEADDVNIVDFWEDTLLYNESIYDDNTGKSRLYSSIRCDQLYTETKLIFFSWFTTIWHELKLYTYGFNAITLENNSVKSFDLNRCCWDNCVLYDIVNNYNSPYIPIFKRELTPYEIECRVRMENTFQNMTTWRHFKRNNTYYSIGFYGLKVFEFEHEGTHHSLNLLNQSKFALDRDLLYFVTELSNTKINEGFYEIGLDDFLEEPISKQYLHFDTIEFEGFKKLSESKIKLIEKKLDFNFEHTYFIFLSTYYNATIKSEYHAFPISLNAFKTLQTFIFPDEDSITVTLNDDTYLIIAKTLQSEPILLSEKGEIFLKLNNENLIYLSKNFESFLQSIFDCRNTDTEEVWQAKQGNIAYFEEFLKHNYINNKFQGNTLLYYSQSDVKLFKFLLDNGADPNRSNFYKNQLKNEIVDLLSEYGYEFDKEKTPTPNYFSETHLDQQALELIEEIGALSNVKISDNLKGFLLKYSGQSPTNHWLSENTIYQSNYLDRILSLEEIVDLLREKPTIKNSHYKNLDTVFGGFEILKNQFLDSLPRKFPIAKSLNNLNFFIQTNNNDFSFSVEDLSSIHNNKIFSFTENDNFKEKLETLLVNEQDLFNQPNLAILRNDINFIQKLLTLKWNPNNEIECGFSPIALSICLNNLEMIKLLIENGTLLTKNEEASTYFNISSKTPLYLAIRFGSIEIIEYLIEKGAVHLDTSENHYKNANQLIENGYRPELYQIIEKLKK